MKNTCEYQTEIRFEPGKEAKFRELLHDNGFDQAA
jgi:hypothetical protein